MTAEQETQFRGTLEKLMCWIERCITEKMPKEAVHERTCSAYHAVSVVRLKR